ncbi:MAG TPA: helical backbone metal receptor [Methanocorpusculum sp.]|nr:helical backbone metal receptor [Methanocorpusculum sp.]
MMKKTAILIGVLLVAFCVLAVPAAASSPAVETAIAHGLDYLAAQQNDDAGIVEMNMLSSSISPTWFTVNAIVAAEEDPLSGRWVKGDQTFLTYLLEGDSRSDGTAEIAKWITYCAACGADPRTYGGYDAVSALKSKIAADGKGGQYVYTTYWTIFGLTAAGEDASSSLSWLLSQQLDTGGFGSYGKDYGDAGDADNTAAAVMAMIAAGMSPNDEPVKKAIAFLRSIQEDNGGFNYGYYSSANLASTAWVLQAFCAAGIDPSTVTKNGKNPVDYMLSLQKDDGSFRYTESLTDSPAGMTARAVAALCGNPYPILPGEKKFNIAGGTVAEKTTVSPVASAPVYSPGSEWTPVTITDDFGYTVSINAKPERIISLAPTNTEILFAVGAGDRVVGVTEYCDYPEEATTKPIIGGYSTPNVEKIVSLDPDLIIAYYGNGLETINHIKELGYNVITLNSDSLDGSYRGIELIGEAVGCKDAADSLVSMMKSNLAVLQSKLPTDAEKPVVVHCLWTDPLWVSGSHTFEDEMIAAAGGINGASFVDGWGIVTIEKFLTLDPDIIIVDNGMGMGGNADDVLKNYFENDPRLRELSAVKNRQVYIMHADLIDRGGPRIVEAITYLSQICHPEIYGEYTQFQETTASTPGFGIVGFLGVLGAALLLRRRA